MIVRRANEDERKKVAHAFRVQLVLHARSDGATVAPDLLAALSALSYDKLMASGAVSNTGARWKGFATALSQELDTIAQAHDAVRFRLPFCAAWLYLPCHISLVWAHACL